MIEHQPEGFEALDASVETVEEIRSRLRDKGHHLRHT
jgi:hypothetical protein